MQVERSALTVCACHETTLASFHASCRRGSIWHMNLPNAERAVVDPAKVRDYLLAAAHPVGRFKARFFVSLGYAAEQWERLRDDLWHLPSQAKCPARQLPLTGEV